MIGLGLGLWQNTAALSSGGSSAPTATVTMTQLASAKRVYQRSTTTGGGQGKGQGSIPVAFSAVTQAGTIHARCSSGGGTRGDLQAEFAAATIASTGAQTVTISGIDARLGWFELDILDSSGTWQNGTVLVGMGRVIAASGQSLMVRFFREQDGQVATNASLSVTINANSSVYATYQDNNTLATAAWAVPADSSNYNSTGCAEYLNRVVVAAGVNCALVGHSRGGQSITAFISAGTEATKLTDILDAVGGFEAFIWLQGHSDAQAGMSNATYQTDLSTLFTAMTAHNAVKGSSYERYVATVPNINSSSWGNRTQVNTIRSAGRTWALANSGVSVQPMDLDLVDGVHESQAGAVTLAGHFYRASRTSLGLSHNDNGPAFTGSRSGATITLTPTFSSGGTSLSGVGTPLNRVSVSGKGGYAKSPVTTFTVGASTITIALTTAPAANAALDIHFGHPFETVNNGAADMIYDNGTDGDGLSTGRGINATYSTPIAIAAPTPSLGPTLTSHSVTYTTAATGFGTCMNGGYASSAASLGDDVVPFSDIMTLECRFKLASAPGGTIVAFSVNGLVWLGVTTAGKLTADWGTSSFTGATTVSDNAWHHVRIVLKADDGVTMYLDGVQEATSGVAPTITPSPSGGFLMGSLVGSFIWTGLLDEFACWEIATNTANFTPPTAPYTGGETGLRSLYHLDSVLTSG